MELHYLHYCHPQNPFYDRPPEPGADFSQILEPMPTNWSREVDSEWVRLTPPGWRPPRQGWKVHASATMASAERVLVTASAYCQRQSIGYKFLRSRALLQRVNSKYGDRTASGKFITIYPRTVAELKRVLGELGDALDGVPGPYILSDLRWRQGPLYVRYGAFLPRLARIETGQLVSCIEDPNGRLVPDVRRPWFEPPPFVTPPSFLAGAVAARAAGTPTDFPFRVDEALHLSNGGGVYLATDTRSGLQVVLKEARPLAGVDEAGRDAVARLDRERWALQRLAGLPEIPRFVDYRRGHEHFFLAREYVLGGPLDEEIQRRNPLLTGQRSVTAAARYAHWAIRVLDAIEVGVRAMHGRGVVFADLHPGNVLVRDDGSVAFIDLEASAEVSAAAAQAIGAPGFRAPPGYRGPAVDRYALGCLRLAMFLPVTVVLPWGVHKADQLIEAVRDHFPVPADFADRVRADLGPGHRDSAEPRVTNGATRWPPVLDEYGWPGLRERLIRTMMSTATPHRRDRLFPGDVEQFRVPAGGVNLAHGAAGVLSALSVLGAPVDPEHVAWLLDAIARTDQMPPGYYDGLAGVAGALDALGHPDHARELLDRALSMPHDALDDTLYRGLAGLGLTAVQFANRFGDATYLQHAVQIAERLRGRADTGEVRLAGDGLFHGPSGVALLLLRLYGRTGEPTLLGHARLLLHQDLTALGWTAHPGLSDSRPVRPDPSFGRGSARVGMVVHDLLTALEDPALAAARDAIRNGLSDGFLAHSGLFRGRAGVMLAVRHLGHGGVATQTALRRHAARLGWHAAPLGSGLSFLGDHGLRLSMDLATGAAGVLLALHAAIAGGSAHIPLLDGGQPAQRSPGRARAEAAEQGTALANQRADAADARRTQPLAVCIRGRRHAIV